MIFEDKWAILSGAFGSFRSFGGDFWTFTASAEGGFNAKLKPATHATHATQNVETGNYRLKWASFGHGVKKSATYHG